MVDLLLLPARISVGSLLLIAGLSKLALDQPTVIRIVRGYDLLPNRASVWVARALPWLEVGTGLPLVLGLFTRGVATVGLQLMSLMTLAVAQSLLRGKAVPCGCFGRDLTRSVSWSIVARNAALILILTGVSRYGGGSLALDRIEGAPRLGVGAAAGLMVVALGLGTGRLRSRRASVPG